jgi:hypothetical protein
MHSSEMSLLPFSHIALGIGGAELKLDRGFGIYRLLSDSS